MGMEEGGGGLNSESEASGSHPEGTNVDLHLKKQSIFL